MKLIKVLLLLACCIVAHAQQQPVFNHVIVVVQENRTPDNLFGACTIPGADLVQEGAAIPLANNYDLTHTHTAFLADAGKVPKWPANAKKYVQLADVQPYCNLAAQYAFGDAMFQTNQGPSLPAHQIIFTGTSAPTPPGTQYSDYFVAENNGGGGCPGFLKVILISPQGKENTMFSSCFEHPILTDLLKGPGLTWKYYAVNASSLWNAPVSIQHICGSVVKGKCTGSDWQNNVVLNPSQVLTDISTGNLSNVSFVTPTGQASDHALMNNGSGPSWVASIVNAVGQSPYWADTVIIIFWDDWGGWYDHVPPLANDTGWCESYCYGFRVPLLVVSAYTPQGYVSHATYDFGSIARFIENNFGLGLIGPGYYADAWTTGLGPEFFTESVPRTFTAIPQKFQAEYFINSNDQTDPDTD